MNVSEATSTNATPHRSPNESGEDAFALERARQRQLGTAARDLLLGLAEGGAVRPDLHPHAPIEERTGLLGIPHMRADIGVFDVHRPDMVVLRHHAGAVDAEPQHGAVVDGAGGVSAAKAVARTGHRSPHCRAGPRSTCMNPERG